MNMFAWMQSDAIRGELLAALASAEDLVNLF